ncbi:hypothetical protein BDP27DRAFT_1405395 [Rhodocollybia butyracea]|uniref:Uncharacterized protein n=1 Tax=Rhodocollybia butyracea TaxID=206335 RepID=A0A9P5U232_9AGAR|nr:hypothetical protein BDP27DRAFT_1405395 [Rhodocollybia butyracea]
MLHNAIPAINPTAENTTRKGPNGNIERNGLQDEATQLDKWNWIETSRCGEERRETKQEMERLYRKVNPLVRRSEWCLSTAEPPFYQHVSEGHYVLLPRQQLASTLHDASSTHYETAMTLTFVPTPEFDFPGPQGHIYVSDAARESKLVQIDGSAIRVVVKERQEMRI